MHEHRIRVFFDLDGEYTVEVDGQAYSALAAYSVCDCERVQVAADLAWYMDQKPKLLLC